MKLKSDNVAYGHDQENKNVFLQVNPIIFK